MNNKEVIDLLEMIDRCYKTEYGKDKKIVNDWYKVLKEYELQDMTQSLDTYMKYNTTYPPKVYDLTRNYQTIENKKRLDHAKTRCHLCNKEISLEDFDKHVDRCLDIEFIEVVAKKYQNVEINKAKYRNMSEEEFREMHLKAVKLLVARSTDKVQVSMWQRYLNNLEQ